MTNPWLEIQVFYVRIGCQFLEQAPDLLSVRCSARFSDSPYELNRLSVSSTHEAILALRRDRIDSETAEAIYVCTDNLRTPGPLAFKVCHPEEVTLVCGIIENRHNEENCCSLGWVMECSGTLFCAVRTLSEANGGITVLPFIEVCVAGRFSGSPVILTQTVHLVARKRHSRQHTLDVIPEAEELERTKDSLGLTTMSCQIKEQTTYKELDLMSARPLGIYKPHLCPCWEEEDGDLTWFNTGVRVGVGIGLGMCVGLGIGVGLLMRGYQATTAALRRKLL
ncbi:hypothetical protein L7F22_069273 [Adiantum nelumboides]|nr:hypothetical protein [Adiantum nelumboides]